MVWMCYVYICMCVQYVSIIITDIKKIILPIGVQKPGSQYSPAIYTIDIAYNIDIPLYIYVNPLDEIETILDFFLFFLK